MEMDYRIEELYVLALKHNALHVLESISALGGKDPYNSVDWYRIFPGIYFLEDTFEFYKRYSTGRTLFNQIRLKNQITL